VCVRKLLSLAFEVLVDSSGIRAKVKNEDYVVPSRINV
jgi:hypothetical protein